MRTGCILVLLTWSRFLLGSTGPIALLVVFLVGWTGGGRWESATRGSPHRLAHTLAPWILALPTFISWAISFGSLWGGR